MMWSEILHISHPSAMPSIFLGENPAHVDLVYVHEMMKVLVLDNFS